MTTQPLEKVRRLMALALGTTSTEEARTTALIALRLINEHKLLDAPAPAPSSGRAGGPAQHAADAWWQDVVSRAAENVRRRDAEREQEAKRQRAAATAEREAEATRRSRPVASADELRDRARGWPRRSAQSVDGDTGRTGTSTGRAGWDPKEHKQPEAPPGCAWIKAPGGRVCVWCKKPIAFGEVCMWEKKAGMHHEKCWCEVNP